jgi:hypothetical protein
VVGDLLELPGTHRVIAGVTLQTGRHAREVCQDVAVVVLVPAIVDGEREP